MAKRIRVILFLTLAPLLNAAQKPTPELPKKSVLSEEEKDILKNRELLENMDLLQNLYKLQPARNDKDILRNREILENMDLLQDFEKFRFYELFAGEPEPENKGAKQPAPPKSEKKK